MQVGSDTYGSVKKIKGTPIVTSFVMLQMLPVYPRKSYYYLGEGQRSFEGIPFFAEHEKRQFFGIPLASIDRASVVLAYVRGLCGAATVIGALILMMTAVGYLNSEIMNERQKSITLNSLYAFVLGVAVGTLTYLIPLVGNRERRIREHCFALLGIAVDPASVEHETSQRIIDFAQSTCLEKPGVFNDQLRELVITRAKMAQAVVRHEYETATDRILDEIERHGKGKRLQ
ncbi:MAG: hypothetical protein U0930_25105 [Pirellulales bacterium]